MTLKAWRVKDVRDDFYSTVVFAETRGQAKSKAMRTDLCEDSEWTDIRITRVPELDGEYRGRTEMEWYNDQDRLALVRAGWRCDYVEPDVCETCVAKDDCEAYVAYLDDLALLGEEEVPGT